MVYEILHSSPRCWTVVNKQTGRVHSKCTTEEKAKSQMKLLYGIESGKLKPIEKKNSGDNKRKMNPWISHVKKIAEQKGMSYREALKIASTTYKKNSMKGKGMSEDDDMMEEEELMTDDDMEGSGVVVREIGPYPPPKGKKCVKGSKTCLYKTKDGDSDITKYPPSKGVKCKAVYCTYENIKGGKSRQMKK